MPEQLALHQAFRNRRAIQFHERVVLAGAAVMNRACHQFLAGAALTLDEDCRVGLSHHFNRVEDLFHRRALAEYIVIIELVGQLVPEVLVVVDQPLVIEDSSRDYVELVLREWLGEIIEGPLFHCLDGAGDGRVASDHDDVGVSGGPLGLLEDIHTAYLRHLQVGDDKIVVISPDLLDGLVTIHNGMNIVVVFLEGGRNKVNHIFFVINHQDSTRIHHRSPLLRLKPFAENTSTQ